MLWNQNSNYRISKKFNYTRTAPATVQQALARLVETRNLDDIAVAEVIPCIESCAIMLDCKAAGKVTERHFLEKFADVCLSSFLFPVELTRLEDDGHFNHRWILSRQESGHIISNIKTIWSKLMNYQGTIIEESLEEPSVLGDMKIISTEVEPITAEHKTPWLKRWTLHKVEISEDKASNIAEKISKVLDHSHGSAWYAGFKNNKNHYIIFRDKVFLVDRTSKEEYDAVIKYGISLGIPDYQLDFSPEAL